MVQVRAWWSWFAFGLVLVASCHPDGPALVPPPDFGARTCPTVPICSPDMAHDLATVEDARYFLDLATAPDLGTAP